MFRVPTLVYRKQLHRECGPTPRPVRPLRYSAEFSFMTLKPALQVWSENRCRGCPPEIRASLSFCNFKSPLTRYASMCTEPLRTIAASWHEDDRLGPFLMAER